MSRRIAIIGAGPMGIAAAVEGSRRGFDVTVLEGDAVGSALRRWGPTRFFTPVGMNAPDAFRDIAGPSMPPPGAILTGPEFVDRVLEPVAQSAVLRGRVRIRHRVVQVGRRGLRRQDHPGHPLRAERPFTLVVRSDEGERRIEADIVLDASGGYTIPAAAGSGGIPAEGEAEAAPGMIRHLGDLHARLSSLAGKRVLLIGHGHSAANAIAVLSELAAREPSTRIIWAVRTLNRRPCQEVPDDPLPERHEVVARANGLAESPPPHLTVERRAALEAIEPGAGGGFRVRLTGGRGGDFDAVAAFTGYRPDLSFLSELPLEISPVTEGPARLYRAMANITDCLSVPRATAADLESGEHGFHFVGSKSYGRAPTFLLQTGLQHLHTIFDTLDRR